MCESRPSFSPVSHSVILASRRESRLVFPDQELDSRGCPENDGGEKDTHDTDNGGLDSRAGLENDGGEGGPGFPGMPRE